MLHGDEACRKQANLPSSNTHILAPSVGATRIADIRMLPVVLNEPVVPVITQEKARVAAEELKKNSMYRKRPLKGSRWLSRMQSRNSGDVVFFCFFSFFLMKKDAPLFGKNVMNKESHEERCAWL